jgi:hypothetical protein
VALRHCGHLFCNECIQQWFGSTSSGPRGTSSVCPICRKKCARSQHVMCALHARAPSNQHVLMETW